MKIPTRVIGYSNKGVEGAFPRGHGNYFFTKNEENEQFAIVNLSIEDLRDAIRLGLVGEFLEGDVYAVENVEAYGQHFVAFITDKRMPSECLTPEHWYESASLYAAPILRKKYNIPTSECLCSNPMHRASTINWLGARDGKKIGICRECKSTFHGDRKL